MNSITSIDLSVDTDAFNKLTGADLKPNYLTLLGQLLLSKCGAALVWKRDKPLHGRFPTLNVAMFQTFLMTEKIFSICPFTGDELEATTGKLLDIDIPNGLFFCYLFEPPNGQTFFWIFGGVFQGPIALYVPGERVLGVFTSHKGLKTSLERSIGELQMEHLPKAHGAARPIFVTGTTKNFGHSLWNDVTGLHILSKDRKSDAEIVVGPYHPFDSKSFLLDSHVPRFFEDLEDLIGYVNTQNFLPCRPVDFEIRPDLIQEIKALSLSPKRQSELSNPLQSSFPVLWVNIVGDKKWGEWSDEVSATAWLINNLRETHPNLAVVFDGWTKLSGRFSTSDRRAMSSVDDKIEAIKRGISKPTITVNLNGATFEEKCSVALSSTVYLSRFGSGMTIPVWIADLPGVSFAPHRLLAQEWARDLYTKEFRAGMVNSTVLTPFDQVACTGNDYRVSRSWLLAQLENIIERSAQAG